MDLEQLQLGDKAESTTFFAFYFSLFAMQVPGILSFILNASLLCPLFIHPTRIHHASNYYRCRCSTQVLKSTTPTPTPPNGNRVRHLHLHLRSCISSVRSAQVSRLVFVMMQNIFHDAIERHGYYFQLFVAMGIIRGNSSSRYRSR